MNKKLYNLLVKKFKDSVSVSQYNQDKVWVLNHFKRFATEFSFIEIGKPIKHNIDNCVRVSKVEDFVINLGWDSFIGVETGFGCMWYYECMQPTKQELKDFDGHCLVISNEC
jgi:hypothetical protein